MVDNPNEQLTRIENGIPTDKSKGDVAHVSVKAALSAIPLVGGPAAELFGAVVTTPLEKRRTAFVNSLASAIVELQNKVEGFRIEALSENDLFISTVVQATTMAIRTHQEEKREALRNAVLNSALTISKDDNLQMIFLNLIDTFTPWHLRMLKYAAGPIEYVHEHNIEFSDPENDKRPPIEDIFPAYKQYPRELEDVKLPTQIWQDLNFRGLVGAMGCEFAVYNNIEDRKNLLRLFKGEELNLEPRKNGNTIEIVSPPGLLQITFIGKQFLDYITSPI